MKLKIVFLSFLLLASCGKKTQLEEKINEPLNEDDVLSVPGNDPLDQEISNEKISFYATSSWVQSSIDEENGYRSVRTDSKCFITEDKQAIQRNTITQSGNSGDVSKLVSKTKIISDTDFAELEKLKKVILKDLVVQKFKVIFEDRSRVMCGDGKNYIGPDYKPMYAWFESLQLLQNKFHTILTRFEDEKDFSVVGSDHVIQNFNIQYRVGQKASVFAFNGEKTKKLSTLLQKYCPGDLTINKDDHSSEFYTKNNLSGGMKPKCSPPH